MATNNSYAGLSVKQLKLILQIEKEKTEQLRLENEKRKTEENKDKKRMKIDSKEYITLNIEALNSLIDNDGFYKFYIKNNIYPFDITNLLNNYNDVNEDMINVIKHNFDHLKSIKSILENQIENTFNQLLIDLFSQFNNSTSLKYLNTSERNYLKGKAPDCSFICKNVNIDPQDEHESGCGCGCW